MVINLAKPSHRNSGNKFLIVSVSFITSMGRHMFKSLSICKKVKKSLKVQEEIVSSRCQDTFFEKKGQLFF